MKNILTISLILCISVLTKAQATPTDTVVVELGNSSKVVFTIKDKSDLEILKQYDFQALFNDILGKLENKDTVKIGAVDSTKTEEKNVAQTEVVKETWGNDDDNDQWNDRKYRHRSTRQYFNFDFGTCNYLEDGKFPDNSGAQYAVKPWGSWYIGLNSVLRTQVTGKFFLELGTGVSWSTFKFQEENTLMVEDDFGTSFVEDPRTGTVSFVKSKLTAVYLNASLIPMIDFGGNTRKSRWWGHNSAFRFGAGPYVGYRIDSFSKLVYKENGDKQKDKDHNNYYLNNMRYGIRAQIGVRSADFFFNYDLNELFVANKGPKLNAFSFGVIF